MSGDGVVGKRVAAAVALQPDLELAGQAGLAGGYRVQVAAALTPIALTGETLDIRQEPLPAGAVAGA